MTEFTPISGLTGGLFIGLSAALTLWGSGRITGISGIVAGIIPPLSGEWLWRALFVAGILNGALLYRLLAGPLELDLQTSPMMAVVAGLLVGYGTRLGSGCTSGHGICGIARLSSRSLVATLIFMLTAIVTVYITHHLYPGLL